MTLMASVVIQQEMEYKIAVVRETLLGVLCSMDLKEKLAYL